MIKMYFSSSTTGDINRIDGDILTPLTQEEQNLLEENREKVFTDRHRGKHDYLIIVDFETGLADILEFAPDTRVSHANRAINIFE